MRRMMGSQTALVPDTLQLQGGLRAAYAFFRDPIGYLDDLFSQYGRLVVVKTPPMATPPNPHYPGTVYLYGPELIQQVVQEHDAYYRVAMSLGLYPEYSVKPRQVPLKRIMTGLPFLRKDEHRRHRRLMMPAFQKQSVQAYHLDMVNATQAMLDGWKVGEVIDIADAMLRLTMRITALTLFGQADYAEGERIGAIVDQWIQYVMSLGHLVPLDVPGSPYRRWLGLSKEIEQATRRLIDEKRASGASDRSLLSQLIRAHDENGATLTEDELIGHISLLLWGSRDASVYAVVWTLFLLSQHPAIAAQVIDEMEHVLSGRLPSIQDLDRLQVLERVLNESLRLLPPFPVIHRVAAEPVELGGRSVVPGTEIVMSVYHTHRIPDLYPNPQTFDPDRWLRDPPGTFAFLPFGVGPRMCIGATFAMQELKIITAMILQRYRLEAIPGTRVDRLVRVTLVPKHGLPMRVQPCDREFQRGAGSVQGTIRSMVNLPE